ncbi:MAG: hypothetical protein HY754_04005 [Nitrospirae bacterium]|nr:hypothetical protein [Nitrospirota bacterium]
MSDTKKIITESGVVLDVKKNIRTDEIEVIVLIENLEGAECLLHWGVRRNIYAPWLLPSQSIWPKGTRAFDNAAVQSPFVEQNGQAMIAIKFDRSVDFRFIDFVLYFPGEDRWDNNHGRNYRIDITIDKPALKKELFGKTELINIAYEIIERETGHHSWTLMHRFNLCYDFLDKIGRNDIEGLALIYVWMRFSAVRQLDWQRNYNTKPREVGHALDRLTVKLAGRYANDPEDREMIGLIMTTLGRGSNAQRVRDEVLNIMHRRHIKEVSGHFMEEWHQKLHNNATPDDIAICEAYLEFLKTNGNLERFYGRLKDAGVTRERLEGYERPIKSHPDFIPHLKEDLIRDFEHFLGILKEVYAGNDLGISIKFAGHYLDAETRGLLDFIWNHRDDTKIMVLDFIEKITESRRGLVRQLKGHYPGMRDILFLDIALEDFLRTVLERNLDLHLSEDMMVKLLLPVLDNLCLTYHNDVEFLYCWNYWNRIKEMPHRGKEWAIRAIAVVERLERAIGSFIDRYHRLLQPKAEFLGKAFNAQTWTIDLFSEEVIRGRGVFILSVLLRKLGPLLRKSADIGSWQLISRGYGIGEVVTVDALKSVQGKDFGRPAIMISDSIAGNEEIPKGVIAIITPAVIDSLSHLSIRARNAGILFATCYDPDLVARFKSLKGQYLRLGIKNNEVTFEASREEAAVIPEHIIPFHRVVPRHGFTGYAVSLNDFNEHNVGYKSNNLNRIYKKLPEWINLPASAAIPFGVFDKVIGDEINREVADSYREYLRLTEEDRDKDFSNMLDRMRRTILTLNAPDDLILSLRKAMEDSGLEWPINWDGAWLCIKRVWASKWNDRAYLSRSTNGIPHGDLVMSVLIQRVVDADYSFVIHTVNPLTEDRNEIYAEVVLGLGEALAGNYPGKALSFTCTKDRKKLHLQSFPGKSLGLFGSGLIFRSDSNGEDLAGYAGAGLYDSFILPTPRKIVLDYSNDHLVNDETLRKDFMKMVANIGIEVEKVMGIPQDIEGVYSKGKYYVVQTRPQVGIGDERADKPA